MEKTFFIPTARGSEFFARLRPGSTPAALPVAGRRFIDYAIESAVKFGVREVTVLDWQLSQAMAEEFAASQNPVCAIKAARGEGEAPGGIADLESSGAFPPEKTDLALVWGLALPMHTEGRSALVPVPDEAMRDTPAGIYLRTGGKWMQVDPAAVATARGASSWHAMNMELLAGRGGYTLPGYSAEKGVHLGRNVVMERGVEARPPVLLCDGAWCARDAELGGLVSVGNGSFVGEGTRLARTVVCAGTFVGDGLVLEDKIVWGRRVIDAKTGSFDDIDDIGLVSEIANARHGFGGFLRRAWAFLSGKMGGAAGK